MSEVYTEKNYYFDQGVDETIDLIYKTGVSGAEAAVDLTGYSLRMDISNNSGAILYHLNSAILTDPDGPGTSDNILEVTLGADGSILIDFPRSLTLSGGALYTDITAGNNVFKYDAMLRNDTTNKQIKLMKGYIVIYPSVTLWT